MAVTFNWAYWGIASLAALGVAIYVGLHLLFSRPGNYRPPARPDANPLEPRHQSDRTHYSTPSYYQSHSLN